MQVPNPLQDVKQAVDAGQQPEVTVRELLKWFDAPRRNREAVAAIRHALHELKLTTVPDFDSILIDGTVQFQSGNGHLPTPAPLLTTTRASESESNEVPGDVAGAADDDVPSRTLEGHDPSYSIAKLEVANRPPVSVTPNTSISEAVTLMLARDFSQLPVMCGEFSVKGLFSWKSLGSRLALNRACQQVKDAMDRVRAVSAEASIFQVAEIVTREDAVLVHASATNRKIIGFITSADIANWFGILGEPFLRIGEIENHVRMIIDGRFTLEELDAVRNPDGPAHEVEGVADLSFGDYIRLLQAPDAWSRCGLNIDRKTFLEDLDKVREIRNDVMHFDPDGIGDEALQQLRNFARFLNRLADLCRE